MGFFRKTAALVLISLKETMRWRIVMMLSLLTGPMYMIVSYVIWAAIYSVNTQGVIGGYTFNDIVTYYVMGTLTYYLIYDAVDDELEEDVLEGRLTTYLLKPYHYLGFHIVYKLSHRSIAFLIEFIPVILIAGMIFGFKQFQGIHLLNYAAAVVIAFFTSFFLHALIGMLAFWFYKINGMKWLYRILVRLLQGSLMPLSMMPLLVQKVLFFLPFQFILFVPLQAIKGEYTLGGFSLSIPQLLLYGICQTVVLGFITFAVWKIAIRKYTGAGQ